MTRRYALAVFLGAALSLVALGLLLGLALPPDPAQAPAELSRLFIGAVTASARDGLHPEPKERAVFVTLTLLAPALVLGWARLLAARPLRGWVVGAAAVLGAAAAVVVVGAAAPRLWTVLDWLPTWAVLGSLVLGLLAAVAARKLPARGTFALAVALTLGASALSMFAIKRHGLERMVDWAPDEVHLEAFLFAVAQSAAGKHCLVDYTPQYGCYGELLAPAVRALGSTVDGVAALMIVLSVVGLCALLAFLRRVVRAPLLAVLGTSAVLLSWMASVVTIPPDVQDVYFQYVPLRFVFPALALLAGSAWSAASFRLALGYGALAAVALLWNPDSGVPVVGSLLAVIAFDLLPRTGRPAVASTLGRMGGFVLATGLVLAAFMLALRVQAGVWPALGRLLAYSEIFYVAGVYMTRMPLEPSCWQVVAAVYLALLVVALTSRPTDGAAGGPADRRARASLQLAVLGLGVFAYYSGRSQASVLALVSWPAWLGGALLLDGVLGSERRQELFAAATVALGLSGALALDVLARPVPERLRSMPELAEHVSFVAKTSTPASRLAVLGVHQAAILLHARRGQVLRGPGLAELVLVDDLDAIRIQLAEGRVQQLYLDSDLSVLRPTLFKALEPTLHGAFVWDVTSADGRYELWRYRGW